MKCSLYWSVDSDGKTPIDGIAGVTDVVSASFNTLRLIRDAKKLFIVRDNDATRRALKKYSDALLIGESTEPGLPFICSNNPVDVLKVEIGGKTIIQKTNNGTTAVADAITRSADPVFSFHWANIKTIADWLKKQNPSHITLIASGGREEVFKKSHGHLMEDWYCAEALQRLLTGKRIDYDAYFLETRKTMSLQYPAGDPGEEAMTLLFQKKELFSGIVPVFTRIDEGIYRASNSLE